MRAFTLVELSIVLVILGLLVGGVLAGQSLIHAAELRSVLEEKRNYTVAANAFRTKYLLYPGDMNNASDYWPGATNGDADGTIGSIKSTPYGGPETHANGNSNENWGFWQHLGNAGLITGTYSGVSGPLHSYWNAIAGTNIPYAKYKGAAWCVADPRYGWRFKRDWSNMITLVATPVQVDSANGEWSCSLNILIPEDAYSLDKKIDDGKPATGSVAAGTTHGCANAGTDIEVTNADYLLHSQNRECLVSFKLLE